ncbi:MAG TPA: cytochrome P450 [Ktedonosporobacter sp.]|nr:cytochrome P450 [Ktedonosporobacter sp.]
MQSPSAFQFQTLEQSLQRYTWFEQMRQSRPVFYDEHSHIWHAFRYEDVAEVVTDHVRFSSEQREGTALPFIGTFLADTLVSKDPPYHRKLRNLVNVAFTPRGLSQFSQRIAMITQTLLDRVRSQGHMDVVTDLAYPLPVAVITEMMGVPSEDSSFFQQWVRGTSPDPTLEPRELQQATQHLERNLSAYLSSLLEERRRSPREDLLSALSLAEIDGERLDERELVNFCILLLVAGYETTVNLIANSMICFTQSPAALERLKREPALMPGAIEEVLRYLSPVWMLFRLTTTDVELSGEHIPANEVVLAWLPSANRDPEQFSQPDIFDITRNPNRHLAFGHGIHFCIGAPLARLEAQIALPMLLAQFPNLQRVTNIPIMVSPGITFSVKNVPMTFQPQ